MCAIGRQGSNEADDGQLSEKLTENEEDREGKYCLKNDISISFTLTRHSGELCPHEMLTFCWVTSCDAFSIPVTRPRPFFTPKDIASVCAMAKIYSI
jgi:hypothetical protein